MAAARALLLHTELPLRKVAEEAMGIASAIDVYTNERLTIEEI